MSKSAKIVLGLLYQYYLPQKVIDIVGGRVVPIGRFYPSSQLCSGCGAQNHELRLEDREWTCQNCGRHHDRDSNAARNIHAEALRLLDQTPVVAMSGS
jgi:putative transposase